MYEFKPEGPDREFLKMFRRAGWQIEKAAQGNLLWRKATPTPPFRDHLSFSYGNQLFFVRIEDKSGQTEVPGNRSGLEKVAEECNGYPCVFPMAKENGEWLPVFPGWNLVDIRTGQRVNPPSLVTDELIEETPWEVHDFAVYLTLQELKQTGWKIVSSSSDLGMLPNIWAEKDGKREWLVVCESIPPRMFGPLPEGWNELCANLASKGFDGRVSFVRFGPENPERKIYRDHPVRFGIEIVEASEAEELTAGMGYHPEPVVDENEPVEHCDVSETDTDTEDLWDEGLRMDYPGVIPLGEYRPQWNGRSDFTGSSVKTRDDLPIYMPLGVLRTFSRIDKTTFLDRVTGKSRVTWTAQWQGHEDGTFLDLTWNSESGWMVVAEICHKRVVSSRMPAGASFPIIYQQFAPMLAKVIECNPWNAPLAWIPNNRAVAMFLPDGYIAHVFVPVHPKDFGKVQRWFEDGKNGQFLRSVGARIVLAKHGVNCPEDSEEDRARSERIFAETGIPVDSIRHIPGRIEEHANVYLLQIRCAAYEIPRILRNLESCAIQGAPYVAFATSADSRFGSMSAAVGGIRINRRIDLSVLSQSIGWESGPNTEAAIREAMQVWKHNQAVFARHTDLNSAVDLTDDSNNTEPSLDDNECVLEEPLSADPQSLTDTGAFDILQDADEIQQFIGDMDDIEIELPGFEATPMRVFLLSTLMNPFGPTLAMAVSPLDEIEDGEGPLYLVFLNPSSCLAGQLGTVHLGNGRFPQEELEKLAQVWTFVHYDQAIAPEWMNNEEQLALLRAVYCTAPKRVAEALSLMQAYPTDCFARFDVQMGKLPMPKQEKAEQAIAKMVERSTNTEQVQAEFKVFIENWAGCELHFLHGAAKFPLRILAAFLLTKCEGVSKELIKI